MIPLMVSGLAWAAPGLKFGPLPADASPDRPIAVPWIEIEGKRHDLAYNPLFRSGERGFGDVPALAGGWSPGVCHEPDFAGIVQTPNGPGLYSHFECVPGAVHFTPLKQDASTGALTPGQPRPLDFSAHGGVWLPCAGQITGWGSYLGSEEYEPDASRAQGDHASEYSRRVWADMARYTKGTGPLQPYDYGWTTAASVDKPHEGHKRYALGRFSHELAYVVDDDRTVYLTDDGTAVGFFMFVADRPRDLTSGHLYAAKWLSQGPNDGRLSWIPLGHASEAEIAAQVRAGVSFDDLFRVVSPGENGQCPPDTRWTHTSVGVECLALKPPSNKVPYPARTASRLETRRYAAWLGATTEMEKAEGLSWDPAGGRLFVALTRIGARMMGEPGARVDDVAWSDPNPCGVIVAGPTSGGVVDTSGAPIDSARVLTRLTVELAGLPLDGPDASGNHCSPDGIANPDNITYLPHYGSLMIGEDTKRHPRALLWSYDVRDKSLQQVLLSPVGGEVTGMFWVPNLNGFGYLTVSMQVRSGPNRDSTGGWTGYLGPFPRLDGR